MLENLNRIFGACFPPLVILGWLGAGIFLYTAFRSGEWRKKLTGAEGFLALLLLFMMANRIPNPAIISFRYLIGIGILTLFWSVWLLRWSWHNCPRRWRGMLLLALVFGICLGGFLKEIRLSRRTRMETELIRYFRSLPSPFPGSRLVLSSNKRMSRVLFSAERQGTSIDLPKDAAAWINCIQWSAPYYKQLLLVYIQQEDKFGLLQKLKASEPALKQEYQGKYFQIFSISRNAANTNRQKGMEMVLTDCFEILRKIPETHPMMHTLREKGVGFARQPLWFPAGWVPNDGRGNREELELSANRTGEKSNAIYFSGRGKGIIISELRQPANGIYWGSLRFRGTPGSELNVYAYCFDQSGRLADAVLVRTFYGLRFNTVQQAVFLLDRFPPEVEKFIFAIEFADGQIALENFNIGREYRD
ncbi:hypothetical protein [uncultured Victivallis sp.]|uniref:hypothetical protein n=1 Tax=uncultured Victivallis sp. TaxID=354118 RepID=UPI002594524A|nr:hypothetical protein [uncultured Victivallis sp.]